MTRFAAAVSLLAGEGRRSRDGTPRAIRLCRRKMAHARLELLRQQVQILAVTSTELTEIHQALAAVQQTVGTLTFPRCDQDDVFELIERVEAELQAAHPNVQVISTFLNSIARSLRNQPEAREACLVIEDAIEHAGIPSTWQTGI